MLLLYYLDLAGVFVFAVSGALAAGRKSLDLLGVVVIAVATAIGGGTLRDVLLDRDVFWLDSTEYLPTILVAALLTPAYTRFRAPPQRALRFADGLGLALFAISGARIAEAAGMSPLIIVVMGTMTGVAGGVVRDVLLNEIPLIFRAGSLYATAAIGGILVYLLLEPTPIGSGWAALLGMATTAGLRFGAIVWDWKLPIFHHRDDG